VNIVVCWEWGVAMLWLNVKKGELTRTPFEREHMRTDLEQFSDLNFG